MTSTAAREPIAIIAAPSTERIVVVIFDGSFDNRRLAAHDKWLPQNNASLIHISVAHHVPAREQHERTHQRHDPLMNAAQLTAVR
jgi:hypothetical protein